MKSNLVFNNNILHLFHFILNTFFFTFFLSTATANPYSIVIQVDDSIPGYKHPIRGIVYLDKNGNGKREDGEMGIPGIAISDGRDVVLTNCWA
jgi:hypothetical protein